jgi:hypothetical protein
MLVLCGPLLKSGPLFFEEADGLPGDSITQKMPRDSITQKMPRVVARYFFFLVGSQY